MTAVARARAAAAARRRRASAGEATRAAPNREGLRQGRARRAPGSSSTGCCSTRATTTRSRSRSRAPAAARRFIAADEREGARARHARHALLDAERRGRPRQLLDRLGHGRARPLRAAEPALPRGRRDTRVKRVKWSAPTYAKVYVNKNQLLGTYRGADGVKTGWTTLARHCLVASAHRGKAAADRRRPALREPVRRRATPAQLRLPRPRLADQLLERRLLPDRVEVGVLGGELAGSLRPLDRAAAGARSRRPCARRGSRSTRGCRPASEYSGWASTTARAAVGRLGVLARPGRAARRAPRAPSPWARRPSRAYRRPRRSSSRAPRRTPSASRPGAAKTNVPAGASTRSPSSSKVARPLWTK